jgi:hypothetical protein
MRRLSPQQVEMLNRVAQKQAPIPDGWTGAKRTGAERTRFALQRMDLLEIRFELGRLATTYRWLVTDKGRKALAQFNARDPGAVPPSVQPAEA